MSRSLGDGQVVEVLKTYAYINDEKLGRVFFPLNAANVKQSCFDLRMKFATGDHVIFTALKQQDIKNNCAYIACSVVKMDELREKTGKIAERYDKFCYVDLPREGRVFVPYSARNAIGKSWLGRGSEVGVTVTIKYFCQPVISDCHFVAFTCEVRESVNPATMKPIASQGGAHRSPEYVHEQVGCIVSFGGSSADSQVYSAVSGLACLPASVCQPYMKLGSWIRYIAHRNSPCDKIGWTVSSPQDLGMLFEPVPYNMDSTRLELEVNAVVNRVDKKTRAAWMWNDQIGRVYVPPLYFRYTLRPFDSVQIRVCYTGQFEDVPWTAVVINELGDDEAVRESVALMLNTCDTWKVSHVQMANGTFYSFLEHETFGSAFAAWTDYTSGETPPKQGMMCRVTVYRQERDKKHIYRAVMVTPLDSSTKEPLHYHPPYSPGTKVPNGLSIPLPKAWKDPVVVPVRPRTSTPPGLHGSIRNGGQHVLSMSEVVSGVRRRQTVDQTTLTPPPSQVAHFNGFHHSNGCDLSPVIGNGITHYGLSASRDSPAASSVPPSEHDQMMSAMSGLDMMADDYLDRPLATSPASELLLPRSDDDFYPLTRAFDAWRPQVDNLSSDVPSEHLAPGFRLRKDSMRNGSVSAASISIPSTAEAETQTEIITEHKVLREIFDNSALLSKILEALPHHTQNIMSMYAFIKNPIN